MTQEKQFLVSVADALIIDPDTKNLVVKGKALLNSSLEQAMQNQEIFAGRGSVLQFEFNYQKMLTISIESADFSPAYLAMQTGSEIKNELSKYFIEEDVTFDASGKATLKHVPLKEVYVEMANGTNNTVLATGSDITVLALANSTSKVVYQYNATVDVITIPANSFPKAYELVLTSDMFGASGKTHEMQIQVPKFKLDGALTLGLTHDAASTFTLNGKTLADADNNYAYVKFLPVTANAIALSALATNPSEVQLELPADTQQLTVIGIRGGAYGNIMMDNSKLTFTSDDATIATVDVNGLISIGASGITGDTTIIRVNDGTYVDVVEVEIL